MLHVERPYGQLLSFKRRIVPVAVSLLLAACGGGGAGDAASNADGTNAVGSDSAAGPMVNGSSGGAAANAYAETVARLTDVGIKGRTFFVATTGNDANDGLSLEKPFSTIEKALGMVNPGDTIEIRGGTYVPRGNGFPLSRPGTKDARIKIKNHNGEKVVLDARGKSYAMYVDEGVGFWIIEGLEMSGGNAYTLKIDGNNVNLVKCDLHGSSNDIMKLVQSSDDVVIYGNEIHHNNAPAGANAQGIDIVGADRTWIAHNYIHHTASIGAYSKGNSRGTIFEHNRLDNIASRGIMLGQSTDAGLLWDGPFETYDGIIRNNVITNTADACLATASSYNVKIYNNSCFNAAAHSHGGIFVSNESELGTRAQNVEIKNNIIVTSGRPVFKVGPDAMENDATLIVDGNLYFSGGAPIKFNWESRGLVDVGFDAWKAATAKDGTSLSSDPRFADNATLAIAADSPAIDVGIDTDLVRDDYNHGPRPLGGRTDMGAYELR